ncbi:MAG: hypothetical protein Tsb009_25360 [Planctomycetaceae bacterium]
MAFTVVIVYRMNQPTRPPTLIPLTAMRRLYDLLRRFPSYDFHYAAVKECLRVPKELDGMLKRSFDHVSQYQNEGESFHDRGTDGVPTQKRRESRKLPDQFVCLSAEGGISVRDVILGCDYVDYEIDPLRTTGRAKSEDGSSASSGGMDLLLSHQQDRLPIVGEIKAGADATLFLALVQSLTYAVELVTPSQRRRLIAAYPGRFQFQEAASLVDIYLIQVNPPKDDWASKFMAAVDALAATMLTQPFTSQIVRRIACLSASGFDGKPVPLETCFIHTSQPTSTQSTS